jgi:hypothetical protein
VDSKKASGADRLPRARTKATELHVESNQHAKDIGNKAIEKS